MSTILGLNDMTIVARPKTFSRQAGETQSTIYEGPRVKAEALFTDFKDDSEIDSVTIDPSGDVARLTVVVADPDGSSGTGDVGVVWEIVSTELSRDMRTHPYFITASGSIFEDMLLADKKLARGESYNAGDYGVPTVMKRYWALRISGVETYFQSVLVLRKTTTVSLRSDVEAAYEGINRVVALATVDPPRALLGPLTLLPVITDYNDYDIPTAPNIVNGDWEWLKKTPRVRSIQGARRVEIGEEYWGADAWPSVFYGGTYDPQM